MNTVTVRATSTDGRVVLWEQRPGYPDIWIAADGRAVTVPHTAAVADAIARGVLVIVAPEPAPTIGPVPNVETFARAPRGKKR
jgi:hypothetical protein